MKAKQTSVDMPAEAGADKRLTLFSTQACHLCDEAEALLVQAREVDHTIAWVRVDIADDDALFERYGWLIPVVRRGDGEELRWPFDPLSLSRFLEQCSQDPRPPNTQ